MVTVLAARSRRHRSTRLHCSPAVGARRRLLLQEGGSTMGDRDGDGNGGGDMVAWVSSGAGKPWLQPVSSARSRVGALVGGERARRPPERCVCAAQELTGAEKLVGLSPPEFGKTEVGYGARCRGGRPTMVADTEEARSMGRGGNGPP